MRQHATVRKKPTFVLALCPLLHALCLACLLLAVFLPAGSGAQQTGKVFRIGYLENSTASGSAVLVAAFRQELNKLGWFDGKNITFEYRFAEGKNDRLPDLAAELVRLKVNVIVAGSNPGALAAKGATTTIPIVMTSPPDPVAAGLIASLARPGGNITGLSSLSPELNTKRLEILKDTVPKQPSWSSAGAGQFPIERAKGRGSSTEPEIGGNRYPS